MPMTNNEKIKSWVFLADEVGLSQFQKTALNSFMPNVCSHPCQLDESIFNYSVVGW